MFLQSQGTTTAKCLSTIAVLLVFAIVGTVLSFVSKSPRSDQVFNGKVIASDAQVITEDFGEMRCGTTHTREVRITNNASSRWNAKSVSSDCNCTAQDLTPQILNPGESATLKITYRAPKAKGGNVGQRVLVAFQENDAPLHVIQLKGRVRPFAIPTPDVIGSSNPSSVKTVIDFGDVLAGCSVTKHLEFEIFPPDGMVHEKTKLNGAFVQIGQLIQENVLTIKDRDRGIRYRTELRFTPPVDAAKGQIHGTLEVYSAGEPADELSVPLIGNVQSQINPDENHMFFGFVDVSQQYTQQIKYHLHPSALSEFRDPALYTLKHNCGIDLTTHVRREGTNCIVIEAKLKPSKPGDIVVGELKVDVAGRLSFIHPISASVVRTKNDK